MEEMFVIFDNEAQFTIDGRTSALQGPAGAPCRMGRSHAIYNPTDKPTQWMNIAVGSVRASTTTSTWATTAPASRSIRNLRLSSTLRFDRSLLRPAAADAWRKGHSALSPRARCRKSFSLILVPLDHLVIPPGASVGRHAHTGVEEVFYVMDGAGLSGGDRP